MKNPNSRGVEVVIVTRNSADYIGACIQSVLVCGAFPVVVDNGSTDNTVEIVRSVCPDALIVQTGQNLGYGKAMNLGFQKTTGEFVVLSNADVVFLKDSIGSLTEYLEKNSKVAVAGPQQVYPDGTWQRSYGNLPGVWPGVKDAIGITTLQNTIRRVLWPRQVDRKPKRVPYLDGAVLAVRRASFLEAAGFDEAFFFYSEESDLCSRLANFGHDVVFLPSARVVHLRGAASRSPDRSDRFVQYMVNSQYLLACKHLPPWKTRMYGRLQVCQFVRLRVIHSLLNKLGHASAAESYKIWMFGAYVRIWRETLAGGNLKRTSGEELREVLKAD